MPHISNLNSVSIKNYGAENETLAVLRELRKLGLIKLASKPKPKSKPLMIEDIKQPSDMVSSSKSLNNFPLRLATAGMTQQQIEDINTRNAANIAVLTGELKQQRLQDIEAQQGQRFADISQISDILSPVMKRFRGSTFPAQQSGSEPVDPFAYARGNAPILMGYIEPDIDEGRFTGGINEGAPVVVTEKPTTTYASEEGEPEPQIPAPRIQPQQKIGGSLNASQAGALGLSAEFIKKVKLNDIAVGLGLQVVPKIGAKKEVIKNYYDNLTDKLSISDIIASGSKEDFYNEIISILQSYEE